MSEKVVHIENLSFRYTSKEKVIDGLNLQLQKGAIYGFLGANGAGKTTTLKMILGLIKSYNGSIFINGQNTKKVYPEFLKEIGSLIENPSFYGHLSAMDNLKIWSKYFSADSKKIPEVLDLLDLSKDSHKKTEQFSTGMKQRLGLATALLHDPQLLILDEPTNGLDPMGIIELRKVLSRLNDAGKTILLSSHILSEVEKMVTHLGILKNGSLVFEGTIRELQTQRERDIEVIIQVDNTILALEVIQSSQKNIVSENVISAILDHKEDIPKLIKNLTENNINIYELKQQTSDLETMFLSISNENQS